MIEEMGEVCIWKESVGADISRGDYDGVCVSENFYGKEVW